MINWPATLVNEIVKERCVLFLGAGVSASAQTPDGKSPPEWEEFLLEACSLVRDGGHRAAIEELIKKNKLLIALQAIKDKSNIAEYHHLLDKHFNHPDYRPSKLHKLIYDLDARVVITTNFDKIYEAYCHSFRGATNAFKTLNYTSKVLSDELRSNTRLIIRAHGSINDINDMIFTRAEYHRAKREYSQFYDVLRAIFLTNTVVFIGCGLDDPDIMLLLEEVRISGQSNKPHYALVKEGKHEFLKKDWKTTYNIEVLEYGPAHNDLVPDIENLVEQVIRQRAVLSGSAIVS